MSTQNLGGPTRKKAINKAINSIAELYGNEWRIFHVKVYSLEIDKENRPFRVVTLKVKHKTKKYLKIINWRLKILYDGTIIDQQKDYQKR